MDIAQTFRTSCATNNTFHSLVLCRRAPFRRPVRTLPVSLWGLLFADKH